MKIIVGLGNPGEEYANTYHNAGKMALEEIMRHELGNKSYEMVRFKKYKDLFEYAETDGVVFVRPLTFMNESGKAVREAMKKFGAKPNGLIVLHDDSDITVGNYKFSFARNSAGHKGVQSIIDTLHTNEFFRGRIGIRPAREAQREKAGEFALKKISAGDRKAIDAAVSELSRRILERH